MAAGLGEKIERRLTHEIVTRFGELPWRVDRRSHKWRKAIKHRRERRRAVADPECRPEYRRHHGYEW